ncbi:TIGR03032 family protein [Spirulina sp. CS-785/01]|uniref:TIGR03032 family protein n=1 Tax=Spirulina sp. CS-785/01 TaxID=3021716 RepID=UPI00232E4FCC|nr:TIGR03032 family protein [Spirulina sp. CS-785/01]MDB9315111.1 TIGR03032 family protein [Spirulina sp. CS-785/01]
MTPKNLPLRSVHTTNFPDILNQLGISLVVSTYQAGKVIAVRADGDTLNTHFRMFNKPMGLTADQEKMSIGTAYQLWELRNIPAVAQKIEPVGKHDACYLPRKTHVTGDIDVHEMAYINEELWFVNTRFSCLCTLDERNSFVPRWRPPFVTAYSLEDRCHLNGLAAVKNQPKYVTALGETDDGEGWRKNKAFGGILMDVQSNEILSRGLSMPHSPRWYDNRLWVLESGKGSLATVDTQRGFVTPVTQLPGFTRGIDFYGRLAFIGLSQVRESAVFSGIPLTERLKERVCGVWVVNIDSGEIVAFLRFEDAVQEIFSVQVLPGVRFPEIIDWDETLMGTSYVLPDEALREVVQPKAVDTNNPDYQFNMACDRYRQGKYEEAIRHYLHCLELNPHYTTARYNLGVIYRQLEQWENAEAQFLQVLQATPDSAESYNNLGIIYQNQHQLKKSLGCYQKAIQLQPNNPQFHFNLGMALLMNGNLKQGWQECEWRWQTDEFTPLECPHPQWDGSDISDKVILVHTEQGAGDAIQFIRYIPLLAQKCAGIILVCIPDLIPLFKNIIGIDKILPPGQIPLSEFQVYAPLMSLPYCLGTTLETIPTDIPYLSVEGKASIPQPSNPNILKVGIVWGGSPTHKNDSNRSCRLSDFYPILRLPNIKFYSLQKGDRTAEFARLPEDIEIEDLSPQLTDYAATARIIKELDLIITVDTSVAHLAGAFGKLVWTLLCYTPDWRWMLDRNDTPWYPTMRLFRQSQPYQWLDVFERVKDGLKGIVDNG